MAQRFERQNIPQGTLFEYRVARLRFHQGYFVRRSVDVWPPRQEGDKLAELDCMVVGFDPQLRRSLEIIECKTSKNRGGEIDRLIWLKGMAALTNADQSTLAKSNVADRTRDFARRLKVQVLDYSAISSTEKALSIHPDNWIGFHDPVFGEQIVKAARKELNSSNSLRRVGKYLFGQYWFTNDFTRVKQLQTFFALLEKSRDNVSPDALRLGIGEATVLFTLVVFSIAGWRNQLSEQEYKNYVASELAVGIADPRSLRDLLRNIDALHQSDVDDIHDRYQKAGAGRLVTPPRRLELEILAPPEWMDAFTQLTLRFWALSHRASDIIRWTELRVSSRLGAQTDSIELSQTEELEAAASLVEAFLTRHWKVPGSLLETSEQGFNPMAPRMVQTKIEDDDKQAAQHSRNLTMERSCPEIAPSLEEQSETARTTSAKESQVVASSEVSTPDPWNQKPI